MRVRLPVSSIRADWPVALAGRGGSVEPPEAFPPEVPPEAEAPSLTTPAGPAEDADEPPAPPVFAGAGVGGAAAVGWTRCATEPAAVARCSTEPTSPAVPTSSKAKMRRILADRHPDGVRQRLAAASCQDALVVMACQWSYLPGINRCPCEKISPFDGLDLHLPSGWPNRPTAASRAESPRRRECGTDRDAPPRAIVLDGSRRRIGPPGAPGSTCGPWSGSRSRCTRWTRRKDVQPTRVADRGGGPNGPAAIVGRSVSARRANARHLVGWRTLVLTMSAPRRNGQTRFRLEMPRSLRLVFRLR